jgi:hypothetical protein
MQSIIVSLAFLCAVLSPEDLKQLAPGMEHCIIRATRPEYFDTLKIAVAPARIFDLDEPGVTIEKVLGYYGTVIQNLRLIKRPGINVWSQRQEYWSEAALAEDKKGRILFLFSETPVTMHDFNEILLSSGLEIIAAQHLEGNAPAQFYLKTGETEINLSGGNGGGWPLPNIIGIRMKTPPK